MTLAGVTVPSLDAISGAQAVKACEGKINTVLAPFPGSLEFDATKTLTRVDFTHMGRPVPGIFRFEGGELV